MNYTLNQLRIFLKVCKNQSVTKASEELHLTQPAVSIQLKNFQAQFDITLTEVVGRKIYITDFGKEIAKSAERILEEVYEINNKSLSYKGFLTGKLKISTVSTGKYILPYFLYDFIKLHPGVELIMDVSNKHKVITNLEKNEVDFSLVSVMPQKLSLNKINLLPNRLYLIGNKSAKTQGSSSFSKVIQSEPIIYRENGSGTRELMEKFIANEKVSVDKKLELTSNEAVKQAVIAGLGYSIMPLIGVKNELLNNELKIVPVKGLPLQTNWSLVWSAGKKHTLVAKSFLEYIKKEKSRITKEKFEWYEKY